MWNRKRKAQDATEKSKKTIDDRDRKHSFKAKPIDPTNAKMEAYYAYQGLHSYKRELKEDGSEGDSFVSCITDQEKEEERQKFLKSMQTPLPASFRIGENLEPDLRKRLKEDVERLAGKEIEIEVDENGNAINKRTRQDGTKVVDTRLKEETTVADVEDGAKTEDNSKRSKIEEPHIQGSSSKETMMSDVKDGAKTEDNGKQSKLEEQGSSSKDETEVKVITKKVAPAKAIPFVPHGYQMSVCRNTIRRNVGLKAIHEWLKIQTEAGFVTRQETVSMIPPVVLSAEPHHAILDTCAGKCNGEED